MKNHFVTIGTCLANLKNRRRLIVMLYTVLVLWVIAMIQTIVNQNYTKESYLTQAFANLNTVSKESRIEITAEWGVYEKEEDVKASLASFMGITETNLKAITANQTKGYRYERVQGNRRDVVSVSARMVDHHYFLHVLTYVGGHENLAFTIKQEWEKRLKDISCKEYDSNMTLKNTIQGVLTSEKQKALCSSMLKQMEGVKRYSETISGVYTCYAYSKSLPGTVETGRGNMNITIAMKTDIDADQTIIYLATPILNQEY